MNKYNFEDFLNNKFNGDPQKVLDKYSYNSSDEIEKRIKNCSVRELRDIVNEIVLWKVDRMVSVNDSTLLELKSISDIKKPEDAIEKEVEKVKTLLKHLLKSKGVRLPMASTFMHFFNPSVFPIIDQRAFRVIYKKEYKDSTSVQKSTDVYIDYLRECIKYYNEQLKDKGLSFSSIDKYLYQLDIEIGNTIKH